MNTDLGNQSRLMEMEYDGVEKVQRGTEEVVINVARPVLDDALEAVD